LKACPKDSSLLGGFTKLTSGLNSDAGMAPSQKSENILKSLFKRIQAWLERLFGWDTGPYS